MIFYTEDYDRELRKLDILAVRKAALVLLSFMLFVRVLLLWIASAS